MAGVDVGDGLARTVFDVWGEAGRRWLEGLPALLRALAADWDLEVGEPFDDLTYHYVARAVSADGMRAVLKLGVPGAGSIEQEARALAAFAGRGAARLLRADVGRGALLLERVEPGRRARDLVPANDAEATAAAVAVMRELHVPAPADCGLPRLEKWIADFDTHLAHFGSLGEAGPVPPNLVERARGLMRELCADGTYEPVLLHGDLHHDNILSAASAGRAPWLAIDPKGLVGDRASEVGSLLFNPGIAERDPALTALVPARVEQFAHELALPSGRVIAWGFVKAVLSEVWSAESWRPRDGASRATRALDVARLLEPRLG